MHSAFSFLSIAHIQNLLIIIMIVNISMATAECPIVGSDLRTLSHRFKEREGLYLNVGAPSQCGGTVTSWHFCYGMSECETGAKYHATFLVYRPINPRNHTSAELSIVPESIKSVSLGCRNKSKVKCGKEMLVLSEQFTIQEGDIVATCLPAEREKQLQIISRKYDEDEEREGTLYQYFNNEVEVNCERNKIHIQAVNISPRPYLQLHLQAEVAAPRGQSPIATDPNNNYSLRFNNQKEKWYFKVAPASIAGLVILIVFVATVAGIALKCRQTLVTSPSTGNHTIAACNPIAHVPEQAANTTTMNDYTLDDNVAYSVPITSASCTSQLQDEHIYEIV